jgi:hypothetical protein
MRNRILSTTAASCLLLLVLTACSVSSVPEASEEIEQQSPAPAEGEADAAEITDHGFGQDGQYVHLAAMVRHAGYTGEFATVLFNVYDNADNLVASTDQVERFTSAEAAFPIGTMVEIDGGVTVGRIEPTLSVSDHGDSYAPQPVVEPVKVDLVSREAKFRFTNPTGTDWKDVRVAIVCHDLEGAIVGGGSAFPSLIPAGGELLVEDPNLHQQGAATCTAYAQLSEPSPGDAQAAEPAEPDRADGSEAALVSAVEEYTVAYFAGDREVALDRLWSARCQADEDKSMAFLGTLAANEGLTSDGLDQPAPENVVVDRIEGSVGLVTYDYVSDSDRGTIQAQPWILEDGQWKYDAC